MVDVGNWTRMNSMKEAGLPDLVGVYASAADISASRFDPVSMGMRKSEDMIAEQQRTGQLVEIPQISEAALSVNNRHEAKLLADGGAELAGSRFPDTHPDVWTNRLAQDGQVLLLVGPVPPYEAPTFMEFLSTTYLGVLPVAIYHYDTGVGVVGPS